MSISEANTPSCDYQRPIVFYDGGCPLCRREIEYYRRLDAGNNLLWVDITSNSEALALHDLDLESAMRRFHVLDAKAKWQSGAWGFAEMWAHLPRYRLLSNVLRSFGALGMLDRLYMVFARWRANRRCTDHCLPARRESN